ncbi:COQ9-domain-containing protein [Cladochytrium replicatum]|nr:COQ9-domain-containing protein [Cladochytrium replicatum]
MLGTPRTPTERLLSASLANVPELGWSYEALRRGAISLGYSSASHGLADRGPIELVEYFIRRSTREMSEEMKHMDLKSMRVTQTVRTACIMRMKMTTPYIKRWPEAVSLMMQPQNLPTTMSNLHELVDEIWFLAGDRSMNYYSKRTLLAGVYTSTEMFMTQDQSPDFAETWKFLDRRLQDTAFFGKTVNDAFSFVNFGLKSLDGLLVSVSIQWKHHCLTHKLFPPQKGLKR